eukprot:6194461-Pleurochrysis_carterae.AAC.4
MPRASSATYGDCSFLKPLQKQAPVSTVSKDGRRDTLAFLLSMFSLSGEMLNLDRHVAATCDTLRRGICDTILSATRLQSSLAARRSVHLRGCLVSQARPGDWASLTPSSLGTQGEGLSPARSASRIAAAV